MGRSTEFSRLEGSLDGKFWPIRVNALLAIHPTHFHPLNLVLVMMKAVLEHADGHVGRKKSPRRPP